MQLREDMKAINAAISEEIYDHDWAGQMFFPRERLGDIEPVEPLSDNWC